MAQPGNFTPILLYSSSTPSNAPAVGNLTNSVNGSELAINIADGRLFYKDPSNVIQQLADKTWTGTVTSVAALTLGTSGTDLSSTVANGTTTPVITLQVPTASATNRGALSAADWTTFNSKAPGVTFTTGYIPFGQGTTTLNQDASLVWDNTNKRLGIGISSPATNLDITGTQVLNRGVVQALDNTSQAAGTGSGITLGGRFNASTALTPGVQVKAAKTNSTAGDYGFDMAFLLFKNGDANMTERMRILSTGNILSLAGGSTTATGTGISFPATQSASADANTLDDYEENTWTPADASGAGLTFTSVTARYTKIGNVVYINAILTYPSTADLSQAKISGLPFAPAVGANILFGGNAASISNNNAGQGLIDAASTTMNLVVQNNAAKTNALLSTLTVCFSGFYLV